MDRFVRIFLVRFFLVLVLSVSLAVACSVALGAEAQPAGTDVFVTPREALLREKPSLAAGVVAKLPAGTRASLLEAGDHFLRVEITTLGADASGSPGKGQGGRAAGYLAREVAALFAAGPEGTRDLVTVGRILGQSETYRRLATALLLRAGERLREAGTPDARVELLLAETAEALAGSGGPFPPGLDVAARAAAGSTRYFYTGDAFQRAAELAGKPGAEDLKDVKERATAGLLRARYPETAVTLATLWQETAAWLQLAESAQDPSALRSAAARLGTASLSLGRFLLAVGRLDQMGTLEERVRAAGGRVAAVLPGKTDGRKLLARAALLRAMRGDGTRSFPQEARVRIGPKEQVVKIDGKLGGLRLISQHGVGSTWSLPTPRAAVPVLPVPGSLRLSPDGRSVAWVEVAGPSSLLPVIASLEKDEPAREIAFLSDGRPLRDRALAHVVASMSGYSSDGQRLGLSIQAWNDTPGPAPRLSVVSVATGELLFETSKDERAFKRLLQ
jgi:hypothetical protein